LPAKRRIYVTPGLVDQGGETHAVHAQLGAAIAASAVDVVVLMKNSVQPIIQAALSAAN
jgi:UDP-N-acetylmuramyl pentapeptide synthase